jgi:hypothetical protein
MKYIHDTGMIRAAAPKLAKASRRGLFGAYTICSMLE